MVLTCSRHTDYNCGVTYVITTVFIILAAKCEQGRI